MLGVENVNMVSLQSLALRVCASSRYTSDICIHPIPIVARRRRRVGAGKEWIQGVKKLENLYWL